MTSSRRVFLAVLSLTIAVAGSAGAENGPYLGASVGQTTVELSLGGVEDTGLRIDDEEFAFKVFFGYDLLGPLAFEVAYRDLGEVTDDAGLRRATTESDGIDGFLIGKIPLGPVKLFAKGGLIAWNTDFRLESADLIGAPDIRISDDGTDFAWGVGVAFELGKLGVRGEYESFETDLPDSLSMVSVGVTYKF